MSLTSPTGLRPPLAQAGMTSTFQASMAPPVIWLVASSVAAK